MRNFVKVLLVGTVLAGACVLLPNDVWARPYVQVYTDKFGVLSVPYNGSAIGQKDGVSYTISHNPSTGVSVSYKNFWGTHNAQANFDLSGFTKIDNLEVADPQLWAPEGAQKMAQKTNRPVFRPNDAYNPNSGGTVYFPNGTTQTKKVNSDGGYSIIGDYGNGKTGTINYNSRNEKVADSQIKTEGSRTDASFNAGDVETTLETGGGAKRVNVKTPKTKVRVDEDKEEAALTGEVDGVELKAFSDKEGKGGSAKLPDDPENPGKPTQAAVLREYNPDGTPKDTAVAGVGDDTAVLKKEDNKTAGVLRVGNEVRGLGQKEAEKVDELPQAQAEELLKQGKEVPKQIETRIKKVQAEVDEKLKSAEEPKPTADKPAEQQEAEKPAEEPLDDPLDAERKQMEQDWASTFPEGYEGRGDALLPNYYNESLAVNHDNASAIGNLLGGEDLGWSENGYTMTSEQAGTLKDLYGITFDSANQQIRFSGKEDDFGADIMNYMNQLSSVNGGKGYQSLLQDHAQNTNQYRYRQYAIDAAQVKVDEAQAKVKKLIVTKGTQKEIQKAREELGEAQKALGKAKEDGKGDVDKYNATITELDSIVTAAKKNYTIAKSAALSTAENFFRNDTDRSNQFADAINSSDFETARSLAYDALSNKTISADEFEELNNKIATVEGTKAEADAKEAEVNQVQQGAETPREVDLQDLVRIGTVAMTPLVTKTELALRDDVNVLAGEIGAAVGAVDDTALSDVDVDASMPSTVSGSAMVVAELLKNANVDLKLLDETFEEAEEKTVVQTGTLAGAGSQAGTSASLEVPEEEKEEKPEDEKKYLTDEQVALIQAKRQMLLKQYVNAAVQISEGMNAVSNKFADRANVLISFSEGVQNEAGAFGLTQDVGRYILLESLRAVALSSAQMGVQAARLLNEREVDNEIQ